MSVLQESSVDVSQPNILPENMQQEEVPQQEGQPPAEKPTEPEIKNPIDDKLSGKFAALSRKEKQLKQYESQVRQQAQQFQQQFEQIKAENEKLKAEFEQYRSGIKKSPLKALQKEGLSFEDLTAMQLNDENPTPEMLMKQMREELETGYKSELEQLKQQLAEKEKKQQEEAENRTITQYKTQISEHVEANPDKYELIQLNGATDLIFEVAEQFYNTEGRILSIEEAADYTEKYLEEEAKKYLQAKKFSKQSGTPPKVQSDKQASVTLSNELAVEVPRDTGRKLTREEQIAEAAKLLKWES